jgi:tRNA dimethylallyltransferase
VLKLALLPARARRCTRASPRASTRCWRRAVDEVERVCATARTHGRAPAMRAVGYRQAWQFLDGRSTARAARAGIHATRQLAKRQITWLRSEHDAIALDPTDPASFGTAVRRLNAFLTSAG